MNLFSKQFKNKLKEIRLTAHERREVVLRLHNEIATHPILHSAVKKSEGMYTHRLHQIFNKRSLRRTMPLTLIAGLLMGAGVSYAAEGSLPGDTLYPIKIHVNEGVRSSLARTDSEKAKIEAELATRRLEETELLNQEGRLSTSTKDSLKANFNEHQGRMTEHLRSLSQDNKADADQIESEVRSRWREHRHGMDALGEQEDDNNEGEGGEHGDRVEGQNFPTTTSVGEGRTHGDDGGERPRSTHVSDSSRSDDNEHQQSFIPQNIKNDQTGESRKKEHGGDSEGKRSRGGDDAGDNDNEEGRGSLTIPSPVNTVSN